jgi:hydroxymethylpyrimidine/phosphomethylpyrimidine kinase
MTTVPIPDVAAPVAAGKRLAQRLDAAELVKGGHFDTEDAVDALIHAGIVDEITGPRIRDGHHVHGTGCALSAAIAALLAHGRDLLAACRAAKQMVAERIAAPARPGRGAAAVV